MTSALITVITRAVLKAAKPLVRDFSEVDKLQISRKGTANFVTNADIRTERMLVEELSFARKNFGFITEESGEIEGGDGEWRFVIDPIDGTTNFIHAIPYFCISVAVDQRQASGDYETVAGVIYDPIHDEMFVSEKGLGTVMNNRKMKVSARTEELLLSTTSPRSFRDGYEEVKAAFARMTASQATVRCSGSAALDLAYVAAGRYDGTWYHSLQHWDMAAGALMVAEAGGLVSRIEDAPWQNEAGSVVAANAQIHQMLRSKLAATAK